MLGSQASGVIRQDLIQDASAAAEAAALLAFHLLYSTASAILDRPRDILGNHLIYDQIVQQIGESKNARQAIVAAHNPNITVNGDTEAVTVVNYPQAQCAIVEDGTGYLRESGRRKEFCQLLQDEVRAVDSRYKQLAVEVLRVR